MRLRQYLVAFTLIALAACADQAPPGSGTLTATLVSPNGAEGSALIVLIGPGIGEISPLGDTELYSHAADGSAQVLLINQVGGELAFLVALADTTAKPEWVVEEVAGPDDELRLLTGDYELELRR